MEGQWSNSGAMATMVPLGKNQEKTLRMWSPGGYDFSCSITDFVTFIMLPPLTK